MREKKRRPSQSFVMIALIFISLAAIFINFRGYLFDSYSIFDDQRNVLKTVKVYNQAPLDRNFFLAPLYFGIFTSLNSALSNLVIIKCLFLVTVPLFIIFAYKIGLFLCQRYEDEAPYLAAAMTLMCLLCYPKMLIEGYPKSLSLPLLLGVVLSVLRNKKMWAFGFLVLIAFIYPPQFLIGVSLFGLCNIYEIYSHQKKAAGQFRTLLGLSSSRFLFLLLIFLVGYAIYFVRFMRLESTETAFPGEGEAQIEIDNTIEKEISDTRTDFLVSSGKLFGVIPKQYLDNRRMGIFGLTGGTKRTVILMLPFFCMLAIRMKKFVCPHFLFILFLTSILLFSLAHIFYKNLYFPSRYPAYTFPFIFVFLFGLNIVPSIDYVIGKLSLIRRSYRWMMSPLIIFAAMIIAYLALFRNTIYVGERYHLSDSLNFMVIIVCLLTLAGLLFRDPNFQALRFCRNVFILGSFVVFVSVLLTYYKETTTPPVDVYDPSLFPFVNSLGDDISLAGYPEMMNNLQALTSNQVRVSLGQERRHENAFEFYRFLDAYYAADLNKVYRYMSAQHYDYLIVQKEYYGNRRTESNNLFSFYPLLRRHEEKLKRENQNKFALLNPAKEIIEFETPKSYVISYRKLKEIL